MRRTLSLSFKSWEENWLALNLCYTIPRQTLNYFSIQSNLDKMTAMSLMMMTSKITLPTTAVHCYCYSILDSILELFTTTRLELDSKSKTTTRRGLIITHANAALSFHIVQILKEDTINRKLYLIRRRLKDKLLSKSENNRPTDLCVCHSG